MIKSLYQKELMQKNFVDKRVSRVNKSEFNKRGWTLVDLDLSKELINDAVKGLKMMRYNSIKNDYKPRRIYHDHLFKNNLAAIELPFNKDICSESIRNLFKEAKVGSLVKTLMNWENPCCDLARLFCMGNYNYRGLWHRDYSGDLEKIHLDSNIRNYVLVGIYLLPQKGFKILKKEYEFNGLNSIVVNKEIDNCIRTFPFPLSPPEYSYHTIDATIGSALFFDPFLLHQGSNFGERLDFHMKFCNLNEPDLKRNTFQDFSVKNILHESYKIPSYRALSLEDNDLNKIPFTERASFKERFLNTIDYRIFLRRLLKRKYLKQKKEYKIINNKGWEIDFFSNTFLQK